MKYVISILSILTMTVAAKAAAPGFVQGNQFYTTQLQGSVTVYCGTEETATYTCHATVLDPSNYGDFIGPTEINAKEVALSCLHEDGSRRDRTESYNSSTGKSINAFNLWISTPFQRPLLEIGTNKIDYRLMNMGKIIEQGTFSVSVAHGANRTCPTTHYNSTDASDCQSPYTICQRYFEQYDYCR